VTAGAGETVTGLLALCIAALLTSLGLHLFIERDDYLRHFLHFRRRWPDMTRAHPLRLCYLPGLTQLCGG